MLIYTLIPIYIIFLQKAGRVGLSLEKSLTVLFAKPMLKVSFFAHSIIEKGYHRQDDTLYFSADLLIIS
jgi:hypothetical protein